MGCESHRLHLGRIGHEGHCPRVEGSDGLRQPTSFLHEIRCPTLIIAGPEDNAVPMHHATMLYDGIGGSKLYHACQRAGGFRSFKVAMLLSQDFDCLGVPFRPFFRIC